VQEHFERFMAQQAEAQRAAAARPPKEPYRKPRSQLRAQGARGTRLAPALRAAYAEAERLDMGGQCQFHLVDPDHVCPRRALIHHDHLWGRRVRPELRERGWAIVCLCSVAHDVVTKDPVLHRRLRDAVLVSRIVDMLCGVA